MATTTMLFYFVVFAIVIAGFAIIVQKRPSNNSVKTIGSFGKKMILTKHEQAMFSRLVQSLQPSEFVVLAQVAMGALLVAKNGENRNKFAQKIVDFVVTDRAFNVLAIIELDDSSHKGREKSDAMRDDMLKSAGYTVLRYSKIPDIEQVTKDVSQLKLIRSNGI